MWARVPQHPKEENHMAKEDVVQSIVQEIEAGEHQAKVDGVGKGYDQGFQDGVASVPSGGDPLKIFTQADLDAAVQAKADADAAADVQLKADFDALVAKEQIEAEKIDKMKALLFP